jgi:hypothetical protein
LPAEDALKGGGAIVKVDIIFPFMLSVRSIFVFHWNQNYQAANLFQYCRLSLSCVHSIKRSSHQPLEQFLIFRCNGIRVIGFPDR